MGHQTNNLVVAVRPATMNVVETIAGFAPEMTGVIPMPSTTAILIPIIAIIAPIAVNIWAVIAIIIAVIIVRRGNTDAYTHRSDLNSHADLRGCTAEAQKAQNGNGNQ